MSTIHQAEYHRNGVSGCGFFVGIVSDPFDNGMADDDLFVVLTLAGDENENEDPAEPGYAQGALAVFVLRLSDLADPERGVRFGVNSWRGDHATGCAKQIIDKVRERWG